MAEIRCPKCGEKFTVNESDYENIVSQIKEQEFEKQRKVLEKQYGLELQNETAKVTQDFEKRIHDEHVKVLELNLKLEALKQQHDLEMQNETAKITQSFEKQVHEEQIRVSELNSRLKSLEQQHEAEVKAAIAEAESRFEKQNNDQKDKLRDELVKLANEKDQLSRDLDYYKNRKLTMSTKAVGESLEQYCSDEFNKIRSISKDFAGDYFDKDNTVSESGSKGDFIYRAKDESGNELVSIMFEMKDEMPDTDKKQKHKNADFLKELDKDRKEKGCEYAILVSMLEAESDVYNQGIVDMSHMYAKMYVIRPAFFIPVISFLKNNAMSQVELRQELALRKAENLDIERFYGQLSDFKVKFGRNADLMTRKFEETLKEIDSAISHLQKTKEALTSCMNNTRYASNKLEDLSMKRLCKDNKTLTDMCEEAGIEIK